MPEIWWHARARPSRHAALELLHRAHCSVPLPSPPLVLGADLRLLLLCGLLADHDPRGRRRISVRSCGVPLSAPPEQELNRAALVVCGVRARVRRYELLLAELLYNVVHAALLMHKVRARCDPAYAERRVQSVVCDVLPTPSRARRRCAAIGASWRRAGHLGRDAQPIEDDSRARSRREAAGGSSKCDGTVTSARPQQAASSIK